MKENPDVIDNISLRIPKSVQLVDLWKVSGSKPDIPIIYGILPVVYGV